MADDELKLDDAAVAGGPNQPTGGGGGAPTPNFSVAGGIDLAALKKVVAEVSAGALKTVKSDVDKVKMDVIIIKDDFNKTIGETKDKLDSKIDSSKISIIETLGIFVALFTFVSIDVQILKTDLSLLAIVGFILVTLGALSFFVVSLNLLVTKSTSDIKDLKLQYIVAVILTIAFFVSGVYLINRDTNNIEKKCFKSAFSGRCI